LLAVAHSLSVGDKTIIVHHFLFPIKNNISMKKIFTTCSMLLAVICLMAQSPSNFWQDTKTGQELPQGASAQLQLKSFRTISIDLPAIVNYLREAPMMGTDAARNSPLVLALPMPNGQTELFRVWESPVMAPELAAQYPMIKTFSGASVQRPDARLKFDYNLLGFHALVTAPTGNAIIWPAVEGQTSVYRSFYQNDVDMEGEPNPFEVCGTHGDNYTSLPAEFSNVPTDSEIATADRSLAVTDLYTYRAAIATTVEYSSNHGNTVANVLSAVTTVINNVNGVMENEIAVNLELVANTTDLFYFGSNGSDPYTNGQTDVMIDENPPVVNAAIGIANYDIGHVFGTNAGGLAQTGSVCSANKARGVSSTFGAFSGPLFFIIVSHEMGHQFNALHTFNLCDGDNESPTTGYEPGAGSTIMSYSGASNCNTQWLADHGDPYYHINSLERMRAFSRDAFSGGSCAVVVQEGNNRPESIIPFPGGFKIPISTPFEMTGTATDVEDADLTYCWEQYDLGTQSVLGQPEGNAPLFRSRMPTPSPTRVFPRIETIINNAFDKQEVLPTTTRPLTFRLTTRDNHPGAGGYGFDEVVFSSTDAAGPFLVTAPNDGSETWEVGQYVEVTWDVANTDGSQVNCQHVDIMLSTDGGYTYPVTLLAGTKNDGSANIVVPAEITDQARVKIKAADNIFFDISNADFSIIDATAPGYALVSSPEMGTACTPGTFDVTLETTALLGYSDPITFSVDGLPAGATASFSPNPLTPGETATMTIDLANVTDDGDFTATITAEANGIATAERTVGLNVVYNDFSALALASPGGSGNSTLPEYTWSDLPNGLTYDIQVATDPGFTNIIDEATGLDVPNYSGNTVLEENTIYYWRVRVSNECGTGEYGEISAFKTISQDCTTFSSTDQVIIPSGNNSTIESIINIPAGGTISDVNVKNVIGIYNAFGDIVFDLTSPNGTNVSLMVQQPCSSGSPFNIGFDDESPFSSIPCPPNDGTNYKPADVLSAFIGENSGGDWKLGVKVVTGFGAGGTLDSWDIEVCGAFMVLDPYLITNEALALPPGQTYNIVQDNLEVADDDNSPAELEFTIIQNTAEGFLSRGGTQLGAGDHFTMADIYSSQLTYTNTNMAALADFFTFQVDDGNGGFFGMPAFHIVIDENAGPNAVLDNLENHDIFVYPNPASNMVTVEMNNPGTGKGINQVSLFNAQGQVVAQQQLDQAATKTQLDVNHLPKGVYLLQISTADGLATRKVVIQ